MTNAWIAGGQSASGTSQLAYSLDGSSWTDETVSPFGSGDTGIAVAYNGTYWLTASGSGEVAQSTDGLNWAVVSTPFGGGSFVQSLLWDGSQWVAAGVGSGTIATSPDGVTWTVRTTPFGSTGEAFSVAYDGVSKYVAVGNDSSASVTAIFSTNSGVTWTAASVSPFSGGNGSGIAFGDSTWVAVGANGDNSITIASSPNGSSWTTRPNPFDESGISVVWATSQFIAGGSSSGGTLVATSPTGATWTAQTTPQDGMVGQANCVAWNGTQALVGFSGTVTSCYSADGITWTDAASSAFPGQYLFAFGWGEITFPTAGKWIVGGQSATPPGPSFSDSSDGSNWTDQAEVGDGSFICNAIDNNDSYWLAVGSNSDGAAIYTSTNGSSWTSRTNPFNSVTAVSTFQANPAFTGLVPSSPVIDSNSAAIMSTLVGGSNPLALDLLEFSVPTFFVHGSTTPKYTVVAEASNAAGGTYGTCGLQSPVQVPIPSGFFGAAGSDGAATIVDLDTGIVYEADNWGQNATTNPATGHWVVYWGGIFLLEPDEGLDGFGMAPDLSGSSTSPKPNYNTTTWPGKPGGWTNPSYPSGVVNIETAAGLAHLGGILLQSDIAAALVNPATAIQHALMFSSSNTASAFRFPATATDGPQGSGTQIPEGAKIWLPTSFNIASAMSGASAGALAIAYALQNYGAVCCDSGGSRCAVICEFAGTYSSGNTSGINSQTNTAFGGGIGDYWNVPELYSSGAWTAMVVLNSWDGA